MNETHETYADPKAMGNLMADCMQRVMMYLSTEQVKLLSTAVKDGPLLKVQTYIDEMATTVFYTEQFILAYAMVQVGIPIDDKLTIYMNFKLSPTQQFVIEV